MLKMKLITFFKNKIVRDSIIVLMSIIMVASIITIPQSNAGTQINVIFRAVTSGVLIGNEDIAIQNVAPGQDDYNNKAAKYNNLYCISKGTDLSLEVYNTEYNLYNAGEASKYFSNYNKALWVVDNMYISTANNKEVSLNYLAELVTSPDVQKSVTAYGKITPNDIKALNKNVGGSTDIYGNFVNRNFIEMIEQLVLWNYTNNNGNTRSSDTLVNGGFSGKNITAQDQNAAKYLYYALKTLADKNGAYTSNGTVNNVIALDSSKASIDVSKNEVGPYYLKANGVVLNMDENLKSKMTATVTKIDGSSQNLDSSKIKVNDNGSFYIDITGCDNVAKSKLNIAAIYTGATTTAVALINGKTQNLINIKKNCNTKPLSDEKNISYEGTYSVQLVKVTNDGKTAIKNNPATFTITGAVTLDKKQTNNDGILSVATGRKITSIGTTETYNIVEDSAPEGFCKYDGTITLDVKFKLSGTTYLIDTDNTQVNGTGKNGKVSLDITNNLITIYIPNTEEDKPIFDLSLRKFISKVDGEKPEVSREPVIDAESKKILDATTTAAYHHTKNALMVQEGSEIEYTIRVYNEGEVDGYAKEITDYLPDGLSFVKIADESSKLYTTDAKADSKKIVIKYLGSENIKADSIGRIIKGESNNIYQEVKIICKVNSGYTGYITNRAEITNYGYTDKDGVWKDAKAIGNSDRDSIQNTIANELNLNSWYENATTYTYQDATGKVVTVKDYYPGVQDDDDFETVEVITGSYRVIIRKVDSSNNKQGLSGAYFDIAKNNQKSEDYWTNNTSVSKVGPTDSEGYVTVIKNEKIISSNEKNYIAIKETEAPEGYIGYNKDIVVEISAKVDNGKYILDKENTKLVSNGNNSISIDVNSKASTVTITIPNERKEFDLALRKFITKLNDTEITNREPKVTLTEQFKAGEVTTAKYEHTKNPVDVCTNDVVTYNIRVYNEGGLSGFATKIMDEIPEGLAFITTNETNVKYGWKMYVESDVTTSNCINYDNKTYVPTDDATKADLILTDYLKDELLKGYDSNTMTMLDYKDVKVAFKVVEPNTSDNIIINHAQIVEDKDFNHKDVTDRDSHPNEWIEGEDDQDIEKIRLRYFDLALRKWVTQAIITENGQTQVVETGHKAEDDPEDIVKVDLNKSKINNVKVKFRYSIRVTNEGEIAGYAKEISDYIPEGLVFVAEDNPEWTQADGKVVTRALENTLLNPGESAEVSILLTWINSENNLGLKINTAEISEDFNDHGAKDIDSIPNNKVPGEDDIDDAPVMLAVKTGSDAIFYVTLALGFCLIIALGTVEIKKHII